MFVPTGFIQSHPTRGKGEEGEQNVTTCEMRTVASSVKYKFDNTDFATGETCLDSSREQFHKRYFGYVIVLY